MKLEQLDRLVPSRLILLLRSRFSWLPFVQKPAQMDLKLRNFINTEKSKGVKTDQFRLDSLPALLEVLGSGDQKSRAKQIIDLLDNEELRQVAESGNLLPEIIQRSGRMQNPEPLELLLYRLKQVHSLLINYQRCRDHLAKLPFAEFLSIATTLMRYRAANTRDSARGFNVNLAVLVNRLLGTPLILLQLLTAVKESQRKTVTWADANTFSPQEERSSKGARESAAAAEASVSAPKAPNLHPKGILKEGIPKRTDLAFLRSSDSSGKEMVEVYALLKQLGEWNQGRGLDASDTESFLNILALLRDPELHKGDNARSFAHELYFSLFPSPQQRKEFFYWFLDKSLIPSPFTHEWDETSPPRASSSMTELINVLNQVYDFSSHELHSDAELRSFVDDPSLTAFLRALSARSTQMHGQNSNPEVVPPEVVLEDLLTKLSKENLDRPERSSSPGQESIIPQQTSTESSLTKDASEKVDHEPEAQREKRSEVPRSTSPLLGTGQKSSLFVNTTGNKESKEAAEPSKEASIEKKPRL